ncbi:MAG: hypothetical protein HYX61_02745 [Gammaproteobacteria bacterium]|jgi:hypothetical protein|nr:hypothetical protein [Gammaproteobacteria bacterium]
MKDFIRSLRKNSKPKQDPDIPEPIVEPSYVKRSYSSQELICIFEYALQKDFSNIQAFRINEASIEEMDFFIELINYEISDKSAQPEEHAADISRFNVDAHEKARVSLNFSSENIPYILCSFIKFGMMNWDFLHHADESLQAIHTKFKTDFLTKFDEIRERISRSLDYTAFSKEVMKILTSHSEHRNPQLIYAIEKIFIDFIADMTAHGYRQEAKVLHTFLMLSKKIISQAHVDEANQVKTLLMLALPVLKGLDLWPETDRQANPFITCMMNLVLTHPVFNEVYDDKVYLLYSRCNEKSKELGVKVETNPSLFERGAQLPINADIVGNYQKTLGLISQHKEESFRQTVVLQFFKDIITRHAKFNPPKAEAIHNFIYLLGEVYKEDEEKDNHNRIKLYAKVLRQVLQIPFSKHAKLENIFDFIIMRSFIDGQPKQDFNIPYNVMHYELSNEEVNRHCEVLQNNNREANIKISQLQAEIDELKTSVKGYEDDCKRLESDLAKMKDKVTRLTLENKERTSSPSTPPSTPPKDRKVISASSRTKRTEESHSPQNSPPKERSIPRLGKKERKTSSERPDKVYMRSNTVYDLDRPRKLSQEDVSENPDKIGEILDDVQKRLLQFTLEETATTPLSSHDSKERKSPTHTPHGSPTKDHKHHKMLHHTKSESDLKRKPAKPF